ncbi:MAG: folate-binding protein YgfZ [Gammaproteobacteria bacterium]
MSSLSLPCFSDDLAALRVTGEDARDFLHGQFCGDVRALDVGQALLTAWLSPKGRALNLVQVLCADEGFWLLVPHAQAAAFTRRLRMFVLRARVQIEDGTAETTAALAARLGLPVLPVTDATLRFIAAGLPMLDATLADAFLPQELNLDLLAGVSFNKGCYPGQEIVARVKFRGTVKRRVQRFALDVEAAPAPGTRLAGDDGAPHGTVLSAARGESGVALLAVADLDAGPLTLDGVALQPRPLPYPTSA